MKMERKKTFHATRLIVGITSVALITAISLGLSGCGKQLSRMEDNQLELQRMMEINAKQIAQSLARIEENQDSLQGTVDDVQAATARGASTLAAVRLEQKGFQTALSEALRKNNRELAASVAGLGASQQSLQGGIQAVQEGMQAVQGNVQAVRGDISKVASRADGLQGNMSALQEALQARTQQLAHSVADIGANQRKTRDQVTAMHGHVTKVAGDTEALQQKVSALEGTFQDGSQNIAGIIDTVGQQQLKFEEKLLVNVRAIADTVNAIQQQQTKLQSQVGGVQSDTRAMRDSMIAVLKQLRTELTRISSEVSSTTDAAEAKE